MGEYSGNFRVSIAGLTGNSTGRLPDDLVVFRSLLTRLKDVELPGNEERLRPGFIGGVKHMKVRLDVAA